MSIHDILIELRPRLLRVRQLKADVWHLKLPWAPWNRSKAFREREEIAARLANTFPLIVLWLSAWASNEGEQSRHLSKDDCMAFLAEEAYPGVWTLLFSATPFARTDLSTGGADFEEAALRAALSHTSGQVAIGSFYDDVEWFVVEAGRDV